MVRFDLMRRQFRTDATRRKNVNAPREFERERRLLLDEEDAEAVAIEPAQCIENPRRDLGSEPE
jgi:hypothetical protein